MEYDDAVDLINTLGQEDDWAVYFAPQGHEHTLNDGASLWVCEKWGRTYVSICLDERYGSFRVDARAQKMVEDSLS